jgi:hypothetical protein
VGLLAWVAIVIGVLPNLIQTGDGADSTLVALGSHAGGNDLAIRLGSANRQVEIMGDGVLLNEDYAVDGLKGAGSQIFAQSYGLNSSLLTTEVEPIQAVPRYVMVNVAGRKTAIGVSFFLTTVGSFVDADGNEFALYSFNAGVLTRLAISADDSAPWKGAAGLVQVPFLQSVDLEPGIYFVGYEWHSGAVTTPPKMAAAPNTIFATCSTLDLPSGGRTNADDRVNSTLPASVTMATQTDPTSDRTWVALY